jgi:hypothetical protein
MEEADPDPTRAERLRSPSFTSGLYINEFAVCASLGLEPLQFVQGYSVLAQSSPFVNARRVRRVALVLFVLAALGILASNAVGS